MNMPLPIRIFFVIFFVLGIAGCIVSMYYSYQKERDRRKRKRIVYDLWKEDQNE